MITSISHIHYILKQENKSQLDNIFGSPKQTNTHYFLFIFFVWVIF
jgi:hypothetical protein